MKVVAYSIQPFEKEFLARANQKKHDITLIANPLSPDTVFYAEGKDAVIVFADDDVSAGIIQQLAAFGVRYIATQSAVTSHIDKHAAALHHIKLANVPTGDADPALAAGLLQHLADETIRNLDLWQLNKCVGKACVCARNCSAVSN